MGTEQGSVSITALNPGDPAILLDRLSHPSQLILGLSDSGWCHWNPWVTKNTEVYVAAPQLWQAAGKKYTTAKTSPTVPQVMKPLPFQGSDKHHILSTSLHSVPQSCPFFAPCVTTTKAHKAIYQKTELTVMLFISSVLSRTDCKNLCRVFMLV